MYFDTHKSHLFIFHCCLSIKHNMTRLQYICLFFDQHLFFYTFTGTYSTSINIYVQTSWVPSMYLEEELLGSRIYSSPECCSSFHFYQQHMCVLFIERLYFCLADFVNLSLESVNFYGPWFLICKLLAMNYINGLQTAAVPFVSRWKAKEADDLELHLIEAWLFGFPTPTMTLRDVGIPRAQCRQCD